MFILKNKQIETFKEIERGKFVEKSLVFLDYNFPDWTKGKKEKELKKFINDMIDLGEQYHIFKEINVQKLMFYKINFDFEIPVLEKFEEIIKPQALSEDKRIQKFYKALFKNSIKS